MKKVGLAVLLAIVFANILVVVTGKCYVYKALVYNFVDIDDEELFKSSVVAASTEPWQWPNSNRANAMPLSARTEKVLDSLKSVAFLIIVRDSVLYEEYWEGYGPGSRSNSFSMAKSYVSTLIGIAQDEGLLQIYDKVGDYLPHFKEAPNQDLTIRDLLMMSSGLNWDESYSSPFSMTTEAYYGTDLRGLINQLEVTSEPGRHYDYLSGNTQALAMVLEEATGTTVANYMEKKLWQPLGATNAALWSLDSEGGIVKAYCCIYSDARDFARLGSLYLHGGKWNGRQLLSPGYVREATSPHHLSDLDGNAVDYYGYQWWMVPDYPGQEGIFYARGILGQYIIVIPGLEAVVVRLGHLRAEKKGMHPAEVYTFIDEAIRQVNGR